MGKRRSLTHFHPLAGRLPALVVLRFRRRGSGSRGMVFRQRRKAVVAALGMVAVQVFAVGDTV